MWKTRQKHHLSCRISHWEAMRAFRKVSLVKNIDGPVSFHFRCLWASPARKMDSDTEGDAGWLDWVSKHYHSMLNGHYLSGIQGYTACSAVWILTKVSWSQAGLKKNKALIDTPSIYVFDLSFGLFHIWYSLWRLVHLKLFAAVNIHLLSERWVLPQIKWSQIKTLPQHVPSLPTLKEIVPLRSTSLSQNTEEHSLIGSSGVTIKQVG